MANELLDFVMSLVRDSDAAARYQADPARAIADAHLTGVTSVDVDNLLPMVSESLSTPMVGMSHPGDAGVWTSGAATAAFDAFTPHPVIHDAGMGGGPVVVERGAVPADSDHHAQPASSGPFSDAAIPVGFDAAAHHDPAGPGEHVEPVMDGDWAGWEHGGSDPADWQDTHHHAHPGFDHLA